MNSMNIGFIGAGNMASAIMNGMMKAAIVNTKNIYVSDMDTEKLSILQDKGVNTNINNTIIAEHSDIIILAVKPNIYSAVLKELSTVSNIHKKIIVSIAAGISIKYIKSFFDCEVKVVRTMPNTPALIGEGMTVTCFEEPVSKDEFEIVNQIFRSIGKVESISENYMNEVIAVNGSSPAYIYMMIEAMADAAVMRGIPRNIAYNLVSQSVAGAARMVMETGKHPGELKDAVCSPAGTTIQAVYQLEKSGFRSALMDAMEKCTEKAIELGKKYS
ncbi:pyrroline-5-carboxylate reductase [Petroclostridium sp. X23]|uniref:pyrroline-5-carboxylate reductase n=1 Tax=Petroclostridium sp. X23 TaxID=3045146 RepID=UPI0024AD1FC9|nr:pyrroline-5-carboxylate reductase [Petroclostridium sp. X23]WHH61585.1 pyrroline-5-carboxylate reductase [Petroclostridium sp. X23]